MLEMSATKFFYGYQFRLSTLVDKTKLSCNTPHRCSSTVSSKTGTTCSLQATLTYEETLETFPFEGDF